VDNPEAKTPDKTISAQLRAETIAYALQSGVLNLGANFFEPYVSYEVQKYYSHKTPGGKAPAHGDYTQNLAGEFAGDLIGSSALILAEVLFPKQLHACTRTARSWLDPLYTSVAHHVLNKEKGAPDYEQQVKQWATFQEKSLVRSLIIASASIAGNVATQKLLIGNPSPSSIIFKGKLLSTALTTAAYLTSRLAFPKQMDKMDKWMGDNFLERMMKDVGPDYEATGLSHVDRLNRQKDHEPTLKS
jgi:hypothetical protein